MSVRGIIRAFILGSGLTVLAASSAFAQQLDKIGVTMGYPGAIGIQVPINDQVALRPEVSFGGGSSDSSSSGNFGLGVGALWYVRGDDVVRTYVIPRIGFSRSHVNAKPNSGLTGDSHSTATTISGSVGAEYRAHPNFGLFAELGLSFAHSSNEIKVIDSKSTSNSWGTRTAIGAIVRF
ncbi:MAG: outer membrane beta-barrel protein [Vicinamibacterales bacterium]